jgi:hypothetical protein
MSFCYRIASVKDVLLIEEYTCNKSATIKEVYV